MDKSRVIRPVDAIEPEVECESRPVHIGNAADPMDAAQLEDQKCPLIIDAIFTGMVLVDGDGVIKRVNGPIEEMFGYGRGELLGRRIETLVPERYQAQHTGIRRDYGRGPTTRAMGVGRDLVGRRKDGSELPVEIGLTPIPTTGGTWVLCSVIDISQRKLAEARIHEAEQELRRANNELEVRVAERTAELARQTSILQSVLAEMNEGVIVADLEGRFVWNPAAEKLLERGQIAEWSSSECAVLAALRGESADVREVFVSRPNQPDGVWMTVSGRPVKDGSGRLYGGVVTLHDITVLKRTEQALVRQNGELERSNKELEQFAYVASHDLQEPLRMVVSYTQLLAKRYEGKLDEKADHYMAYAVDGAKRMQQLITDLLTYSRVTTQARGFTAADCNVVLEAALSNLQWAIAESHANVTHVPLPTVMAEGAQLAQVFQNLVGNALKFRGERPPRIHISVAESASQWTFSVSDNGIGIDPQHGERIFVMFQRLHTRAEYPGTGIGLAICKKIVERHGGRIWVESEPGLGTCFRFTLPRTPPSGLSHPKHPSVQDAGVAVFQRKTD